MPSPAREARKDGAFAAHQTPRVAVPAPPCAATTLPSARPTVACTPFLFLLSPFHSPTQGTRMAWMCRHRRPLGSDRVIWRHSQHLPLWVTGRDPGQALVTWTTEVPLTPATGPLTSWANL